MSRVLPTFYCEAEMAALVRQPDTSTLKGRRDRAILAVLAATGVRASELCQLLRCDVTPSLVFVRKGKFGAQRYVPLSARAWASVVNYLAVAPARPNAPLFRTLEGRSLSRRLLHKLVTNYSLAIGLQGGVHTVRHSFATRALNRGVSLQSVRAMLGHVTIAATSIYLGVATQALVAEYRRCLEQPALGGGAR